MNGYVTLGRISGIPIRFHLLSPVVFAIWTGMSFDPIRWGCVFFLIVVHEFGHAAMVRASGAYVIGINIHGLGGECWWQGEVSPMWRAGIAWGGVLGQATVAVAALAVAARFEPAETTPLGSALVILIASNAGIAIFNLLPFRPLDGAEAWRIVPLLLKRKWRKPRSLPKRNLH